MLMLKSYSRQTHNTHTKKQDRFINCRNFIEPNVDFAKQTFSPSPPVTGAQCDLTMALILNLITSASLHLNSCL